LKSLSRSIGVQSSASSGADAACVVFGIPREAIKPGGLEKVLW
jgi:hypothetical protein